MVEGSTKHTLRSLFCSASIATFAGAVAIACGGANPPPAAPVTATPTVATSASASAAPAVVEAGPRESLQRASVLAAIKGGLGHLLGLIEVDAVLEQHGNKQIFVGWRVTKLRGPAGTWDGIDLRVGDVVTNVNGFRIEREGQADAAFKSLAIASELRVAIVRDGKPTELRFSIIDDTAPVASTSAH